MKLIRVIAEPLLRPKRYKVFYGGRAGAKSMQFALCIVKRCREQRTRVLCLRETLKSIEGSVKQELEDAISVMEEDQASRLEPGFFTVRSKDIIALNGSRITFDGIKTDPAKIKSFKDADICWVEEAEGISEDSWDKLDPTIRKEGSEIWVSFNTGYEDDPTYLRFVEPFKDVIEKQGFYEDDLFYVRKVTYKDNPLRSSVTDRTIKLDKERNYKRYLNVWEGETKMECDDAIIQPEWFEAAIDAHLKLGFEPMGLRVASFDPADTGDAKALMGRHGSVIIHLEEWENLDINGSVNKVFQFVFANNYDQLVYDANGVGVGLKIGLSQRIAGRNIEICQFFDNSEPDRGQVKYKDGRSNKDTFKNKRAQYFWDLHDRFESTFLAVNKKGYFPPEKLISINSSIPEYLIKKLRYELINIRRIYDSDYIKIEPKTATKKRIRRSPNLADAGKMLYANKDVAKKWSQPLNFKAVNVI